MRVANVRQNYHSPEIKALVASDADLARVYDEALLQAHLEGFKHPMPRTDGGYLPAAAYDKRTNKPYKGLALVTDDPKQMSDVEYTQMQLNEVADALRGASASTQFTPNELAAVVEAARRIIAPGDLATIGRLGTTGRVFPTDHPDPALRGKRIPVNMTPEQNVERSNLLLSQVAGMVNPETGAQLTGNELDAMHKQPAALRPDLVAEPSNIFMGGRSLNQGEGRREGAELEQSRKKRQLRLQAERFKQEHGIPNTQRGGIDKQTTADARIVDQLSKAEMNAEILFRRKLEKEMRKHFPHLAP